MLITNEWRDYELIDTCKGEKLERFGDFIMIRPDPQIIWETTKDSKLWSAALMHYHRSKNGGGNWEIKSSVPDKWTITFKELKFYVKPTDFKHMGIFPEQAVNWAWIIEKIKNAKSPVKALNLFAYTGGATLAAAYGGASVCHVDAAKGMNAWAKDNLALSGLSDKNVRFITDDVIKFVQREIRRGNKYDAIIMDPPSYGRGPSGEIWKIEDNLNELVKLCSELLTDKPLFFLINSYTTGFSPLVLENILHSFISKKFKGRLSSGELGIKSRTGYILPCGIFGRWEN